MKPTLVGALCVACALCGAWLALAARQRLARRAAQAKNARGKRGERRAEGLLEAHGYRICARQARTSYAIEIDRESEAIELVLDFVVERDGERLVAEVKTGSLGATLAHAETRRQLLEYQLATGSTRALLVDPERETIHDVRFPIEPALQRSSAWRWAVAFAIAAGIAVLLRGFVSG